MFQLAFFYCTFMSPCAAKYIARCFWLFLLGSILLLTTGCGNIRQAQQTIATADSLDTEYILYRDTVALRRAANALDKPFVRQCNRTDLAKAYYYLGRNYSAENRIADAANCYIVSDKLHPHDYILRGRVNSCMGFICGQQCADSTALIFYQRAAEHFEKSGNEWRYAYGLLTITDYLTQMKRFSSADSILQIAQHFQLDSIYYERLIETWGLYFYRQQQYDSALHCFLSVKDYLIENESKCFLYQKIMQTYQHLDQEVLSVPYAEYIVAHSKTAAYRSNAYYVLEEYAKAQKDVELLACYAHKREDDSREREALNCGYASAIPKLNSYIVSPKSSFHWQIAVIIMVFVCLTLLALSIYLRNNKQKQLHNSNVLLQQKDNEIQRINTELNNKNNQHLQQHILQFRTQYPMPLQKWNDYSVLLENVNTVLPTLPEKLKEYNLAEREIQLCLYIILYDNLSLSALSKPMCYSAGSMQKTKQRIAAKLGTTSANLYSILLNMALSQ